MSLSKRWGSWKRSLSNSKNSDTTPTSLSLTTTIPQNNKQRTGSMSGSSGKSNKSGKTSLSSSPSSPSSPFSWFRSSPHRSKKRKSLISPDDPAFARLHKPFTPQNLKHQKMLSTFDWSFNDDHDDDQRRRPSLSISPCATRDTNVDDYTRDYGCGYCQERQGQHDYSDDMLPPNCGRDALSGQFSYLSMASDRRLAQENFA